MEKLGVVIAFAGDKMLVVHHPDLSFRERVRYYTELLDDDEFAHLVVQIVLAEAVSVAA